MSLRSTARLALRSVRGSRSMSYPAAVPEGATEFDLPAFKTHLIDGPAEKATATKEEMLHYLDQMLTIRRFEIVNDSEYKMRNIRGFCHLYDGQEAIAVGTQAALTNDDSWITTYRCHATAFVRGSPVHEIFGELFGLDNGVVAGRGGSMHMYNKKNNFYGGAAIVGAQVPVGAGAALANQYEWKMKGKEGHMDVSISMCGDGSANQGQAHEAANMAALWKLPHIFIIENNQYGMGTSTARSSFLTEYYKQGNMIPGIQCDGFDVLATRECMRFAKDYCGAGNGPLFVEFKTYRYHGHSMSDPGITYRDRDEVNAVRKTSDCIELMKSRVIEAGFLTAEEVTKMEKGVRKTVAAELKIAKAGNLPSIDTINDHIFHEEIPAYIRQTEEYPGYFNSAAPQHK